MGTNESTVTLSVDELRQLERLAVQEAKLEILVEDFQANKKRTERHISDINDNISRIYDITREFPAQINQTKDDIERDFSLQYMTKTDGKLLEQHVTNIVKSVKLWILATVGGFTSAGLVILWAVNIFNFPGIK